MCLWRVGPSEMDAPIWNNKDSEDMQYSIRLTYLG
jgi:hypothetical protein